MDLLRAVHTFHLNTPFGIFLSTPYVVAALVLFAWSLGPALKGQVGRGFVAWLRLTWVLFLLPGVTGVLLALGGARTASATDVGGGLTRYGFPVDPSRNWEHWMYTAFCLLSLYIVEVLVGGRVVARTAGLRLLPVVTLFMYGCAFMISRVAVFPGSTPGT